MKSGFWPSLLNGAIGGPLGALRLEGTLFQRGDSDSADLEGREDPTAMIPP